MKKSEYEKLTPREKHYVWHGHKITLTWGITTAVVRCDPNQNQHFVCEVKKMIKEIKDGQQEIRHTIELFRNGKAKAFLVTTEGFRTAIFMAVGLLRHYLSAKRSHNRWHGWEPEEEEVAK